MEPTGGRSIEEAAVISDELLAALEALKNERVEKRRKERARELAIDILVAQGLSRDWAESHVGTADFVDSALTYDFRPDLPVQRLVATFNIHGEL
jgi:hypothetical protein